MRNSDGAEKLIGVTKVTIGERVLLPRVREAERDTLIITDGFSCREQIMHGTQRKALHLAEVLQMGMRQPLDLRRNEYIETRFVQEEPSYPVVTAALGAGALLAAGVVSPKFVSESRGKQQQILRLPPPN